MDDGHCIMEYVMKQTDIDLNKVFVHGRSLGGAVAIYTMTSRHYKVAGIVVENTFTSISAMVDNIFPSIAFLKGLVLRNWWENDKRIGKIGENQGILFINAENDEIVPTEHINILYKMCNSRHKESYMTRGAGHNGSY